VLAVLLHTVSASVARIGEIDAALGVDPQVIEAVEPFALVLVRQDCDIAFRVDRDQPPAASFAGQKATALVEVKAVAPLEFSRKVESLPSSDHLWMRLLGISEKKTLPWASAAGPSVNAKPRPAFPPSPPQHHPAAATFQLIAAISSTSNHTISRSFGLSFHA